MRNVLDYKDNERKLKAKSDRVKGFWIITGAVIITALIISFFPYRIIRISGNSMYPTLKDGEMITAKKLYFSKNYSKNITYGDIVITSGFIKIIKRVVALPGDTVEFKDGGFLYVNGEYSPYNNVDKTPMSYDENEPKVELKDNEYYLLGDNRDASDDSRVYGPFTKFSYKFIKVLGG